MVCWKWLGECGWYIFRQIRIFKRGINSPKPPESAPHSGVRLWRIWQLAPYWLLQSRFKPGVNTNQFLGSVVTGYTSCPLWYHCIINTEWFLSCPVWTRPINWAHFPPPPMSHHRLLSSAALVPLTVSGASHSDLLCASL